MTASKYKSEYAEQARKLCKLGATDMELAEFFDVALRTIYNWAGTNGNFAAALKIGKDEADDRVERSLFLKAVGYSHPDVHISNYQGAITATPITKHHPPDTVACIFWLKNRRKKEWRDKQEFGVTDKDGDDVPMTDMEVARRVAFALSKGVRDPQP